jgi:hypothetical protein
MVDFPGPQPPQGGREPFRLQDLDLSRVDRLVKLGLWILAVVILWQGVVWAQSFYTDWLWFSALGHEDVLLTTTWPASGLYVVAWSLFLALAAPNLRTPGAPRAARRRCRRGSPRRTTSSSGSSWGRASLVVMVLAGTHAGRRTRRRSGRRCSSS